MTAININKLPEASFGDIKFYYQDSSIEGGRKTITHEYPDSNKRFIEDLGGLQKTFNINALIDNTLTYSLRDRFIEKLENGEVDILTHPEYNTKTVKCINYIVDNSINQLGVTRFNIVFAETENESLLIEALANQSVLEKLRLNIRDKISGITERGWAGINKNNFTAVKSSFDNYLTDLRRIRGDISQLGSGANAFSSYINSAVSQVGALIQTPQNLSNSINNSFENLKTAFSRSKDLFSNLSILYNFTTTKPQGNSNINNSVRNNNTLFENQIRVNALTLGYETASNIEYSNQEELNNAKNSLEVAYNNIQSSLPSSVLRDIQDLKIKFNNISDNLSLSLPKVSNYTTNNISLNVLCYSLYGNLDLKEDIKNLNKFQDTMNIEGEIKIFTNV